MDTTEQLADPEARALFGDNAYSDDRIKKMARQFGWFYGIQDKARKGQKLSDSQVKCNTRMGRIRAAVEHPFAWMKTQSGGLRASGRSRIKNELTFDFKMQVQIRSNAIAKLETGRIFAGQASMTGEVCL